MRAGTTRPGARAYTTITDAIMIAAAAVSVTVPGPVIRAESRVRNLNGHGCCRRLPRPPPLSRVAACLPPPVSAAAAAVAAMPVVFPLQILYPPPAHSGWRPGSVAAARAARRDGVRARPGLLA